jgi:nitrite reductase (NADH) large subunit
MQTGDKPRLVIVGNGMATGRFLDDIHKRAPGQFSITVIGDEPEGSYNRIMLSPVLAGETSASDIIGKPAHWYREQGIEFLGGVRIARIDRQAQCVVASTGKSYRYDHLVLAVGSRPARIPAKNQDVGNIYAFRTLQDVDRIMASAHSALECGKSADTDALVIGGGLLGLEAAYGLALKGLRVMLLHRSGWLLNRQLDPAAALLLQQVMESKNVNFILSDEVVCFTGTDQVEGAQLKSGKSLSCKLAVIATGITPNVELGLEAGLVGKRGIEVDACMATSDPNISAIGECTEFEGATFGLVEPIWQHCAALADRLCFAKTTRFVNSPVPTKLKVSGVQLFSAGDFITTDAHRELLYEDAANGVYRKILLKDNRIVGVVLFGDTRDGPDYFAMLQDQRDVSDIAPFLLMGRAFYAAAPNQPVAA